MTNTGLVEALKQVDVVIFADGVDHLQDGLIKTVQEVGHIKVVYIIHEHFFATKYVNPNILPMSKVCHNHSFLFTSTLKAWTCVMTLLVLA